MIDDDFDEIERATNRQYNTRARSGRKIGSGFGAVSFKKNDKLKNIFRGLRSGRARKAKTALTTAKHGEP